MQTPKFKETYRLRLLHYETMLSRTRIIGAMMGVAVIYVSSERVGSDVILASVLSLLCVAAIALVRSYGGYQTLADVIRILIDSGHIYAEEAIRPEVNHDVFLQKNKDAALSYDITMYSVILATGLILLELWGPIALSHDFNSVSDVASVAYGVMLMASILLIPKFAKFGTGDTPKLLKAWPVVPVVIGVSAYLLLTFLDYPPYELLCVIQIGLIYIGLSVVWKYDRRQNDHK